MGKCKQVYTTGDVARICHVAPRTVSKWFDSGQLKGYRIPGSRDRRIPLEALAQFMKRHNMPMDQLPSGKTRVLIVDENVQAGKQMSDLLENRAGYEVRVAHTNFEAGLAAQKYQPHVMVIAWNPRPSGSMEICHNIRTDEELRATRIIGVASGGAKDLLRHYPETIDDYLLDPTDTLELIRKIEHAVDLLF